MKPNEFLTLIEGYWKEKLTPENRRIYRKAVERFKPDAPAADRRHLDRVLHFLPQNPRRFAGGPRGLTDRRGAGGKATRLPQMPRNHLGFRHGQAPSNGQAIPGGHVLLLHVEGTGPSKGEATKGRATRVDFHCQNRRRYVPRLRRMK